MLKITSVGSNVDNSNHARNISAKKSVVLPRKVSMTLLEDISV